MKVFGVIFTILVVIVITVMTVFPHFQVIKKKSKSYTAMAKIEPIRRAIRRYIFDTDKLPNRLDDLIECPEGLESTWAGPYLSGDQLKDPWGNKYKFDYGYRLQSLGADGIKGGTGENADIEKFTGLIKNEN
jgi:general secretion pathway protein G